jgi:hypothetical protein
MPIINTSVRNFSMRLKIAAPTFLVACLLFCNPAMAGTLSGEVRGGVAAPSGGTAKATVGAALGYEADLAALGTGVFAGLEQSVEKATTGNGDLRWGTSARAGVKVLLLGKIYAVAGYHYGNGPKASSLGAGFQKGIGSAFVRIEGRHYFTEGNAPSSNSATLGIGVSF